MADPRRRPRAWVDLALILAAILLAATLSLVTTADSTPGMPPPTGTTVPRGAR